MIPLYILFGVIVTLLGASEAQRIEILKPIRATGDEVALIFTSGVSMYGKHYKKIAQAIQEASELRIWVALNEKAYHAFAGRYRVHKAPEDSIRALKKAGMTSENYIGVAHGDGGDYHQTGAKTSELKAVILMGSPLPRHEKRLDYPLPLLTLAAELDGITRITRMLVEFEKWKEAVQASSENIYKKPVILIEGANHAQFAAGDMPSHIKKNDLTPNITEDEAHRTIGKHVNNFLTALFGSSRTQVDTAKENLEKSFARSTDLFQPFLELKAMDVGGNGNGSLWTIRLQEYIADEFAKQIQVNNRAGEFSQFFDSNPTIKTKNNEVVVNTHSRELYRIPGRYTNTNTIRESPSELEVKLKSKDAIWKALALLNGTDPENIRTSLRREPVSCKSLNELALEVALNHATPAAQYRYRTQGRPIIFEEDSKSWTELLWSLTDLSMREDQTGLHVTSKSYTTLISERINPGVIYCKLVSPFSALEWVTVDSLKPVSLFG
ncbi:hypothetical protein ElyMa_002644000 [Elysia marginata]|uniref:Uncharacterized protein n=1 Tax=Elysia marginata TaxID=1093978 RepID=A0AAV4H5G7_9GAST|nr:hypothetical protein ElyMa_002644000 [Elysia marginata]